MAIILCCSFAKNARYLWSARGEPMMQIVIMPSRDAIDEVRWFMDGKDDPSEGVGKLIRLEDGGVRLDSDPATMRRGALVVTSDGWELRGDRDLWNDDELEWVPQPLRFVPGYEWH